MKKFTKKYYHLHDFTLLNSSDDEKYLTNKCLVLFGSCSKLWNFWVPFIWTALAYLCFKISLLFVSCRSSEVLNRGIALNLPVEEDVLWSHHMWVSMNFKNPSAEFLKFLSPSLRLSSLACFFRTPLMPSTSDFPWPVGVKCQLAVWPHDWQCLKTGSWHFTPTGHGKSEVDGLKM